MTRDDLPAGFVSRMENQLQEEADAFFSSYERPYRRCLRVNTLKLSVEAFQDLSPFSLTPVPWEERGFYVADTDTPGRHPYHDAGLYYMQEASAMAVASLGMAEAGENERILDLCAAPGGKSTAIAAKMRGGLLVSNEIDPVRVKALSQNIERMGITNCLVTNEDSDHLAEHFPGFFDRIFLDAPCSGEGMFRKEEAAITQWSQEKVDNCAETQRMLLENASKMLAFNGHLVYSTCTFSPEEDEQSIAWFLATHPDFHLLSWKEAYDAFGFSHADPHLVPEEVAGVTIPESVRKEIGNAIRLYPHRVEGEGHFIALMTYAGREQDV